MKIELGQNATRLCITVLSALICGAWMYYGHGKSGVGWFVFSLFLIWGNG